MSNSRGSYGQKGYFSARPIGSKQIGDFWQFSPTKLTVTDKLFTPSCAAHLKVP